MDLALQTLYVDVCVCVCIYELMYIFIIYIYTHKYVSRSRTALFPHNARNVIGMGTGDPEVQLPHHHPAEPHAIVQGGSQQEPGST